MSTWRVSDRDSVFHIRYRLLIYASLFIIGMLIVALPQTDYLRAVPGDLGDARFNSVILEHLYLWIRGVDLHLWSPGFYYPFQGALTFSDNHFGSGWIYVLFRALGLNREEAFNGWYLAAFGLNFAACAYSLRRFRYSPLASSLGAFIFAFALPVTEQSGHAQLAFRFAIPLALSSWRAFIEDKRATSLGWLFIWVTVEFYCSIYLGYFLTLLLAAYVLAAYVSRVLAGPTISLPHSSLRTAFSKAPRSRLALAVTMVFISLAALAVLLYPYHYYSRIYGFVRNPSEIATMMPSLASYLLADWSIIWSPLCHYITDVPMRWEHQMFFGLGPVILAVFALRGRKSPWVLVSSLAFLILFIFTLQVSHFSLYYLIERLPGANAIRAVSRIVLVMLFPIALLAAAGIDYVLLAQRGSRTLRYSMVGILAIFTIVECSAVHSLSVPISTWRSRISPYKDALPPILPKNAILFVPVVSAADPQFPELDGIILAQDVHRNTLDGYSGNSPPGFYPDFNDPCRDVTMRLTSYARMQKLDGAQLNMLESRVVPLGLPGCHHRLINESSFSGPLPDAAFRGTSLEISSISVSSRGELKVSVKVHNASSIALPALSLTNNYIRFSWRFRDTSTGVPLSGWNGRQDLSTDVPPHATRSFEVNIKAPVQKGQYFLDVTLVQEFVAWFQDRGNPPATATEVITVHAPDDVSLGSQRR